MTAWSSPTVLIRTCLTQCGRVVPKSHISGRHHRFQGPRKPNSLFSLGNLGPQAPYHRGSCSAPHPSASASCSPKHEGRHSTSVCESLALRGSHPTPRWDALCLQMPVALLVARLPRGTLGSRLQPRDAVDEMHLPPPPHAIGAPPLGPSSTSTKV